GRGLRFAWPLNRNERKIDCFAAFPNIKVSKITSPVLITHTTDDEVIDFSHGFLLKESCWKAVEDAGHNDIELYSQYLVITEVPREPLIKAGWPLIGRQAQIHWELRTGTAEK
uniref:Uncharacterized protein n=1 Tax=Monodelphis domestica TaxID=13616 RepID=A0A5F8HI12_MONDO